MRWITNTCTCLDADYVVVDLDETRDEAIQRKKDFLKGKVIGQPKATDYYTVAELVNFRMVGVYDPNREEGEES